jgi:hypothetical protein
MSRQNKVNPGRYTQRGRLTQDDAARELRKQSSIGSPHTWQPVNTKARPRPEPAADRNGESERETTNKRVITSSTSNPRAKAGKANTDTTGTSKRTTRPVKTKTAAKTDAAAKTRKAGTTAAKRSTRPATKGRNS